MGEISDFASFVEEQLPRLRSYVARMPGARHSVVEDVLQEALLRAYQARSHFESDEHAVNWICQVVRNLLVDRRRRWIRRPVLPHADLDDVGERAPDPADLVVAAEQAQLAVHALTRLSQAQRELLWEHVIDGVSYAEIARRTSTPLATVRSLAHRARAAASREFAAAGGALAAMPALVLRPWRRHAHRLVGLPPAAVDALAAAGVVVVAIAMPIGAIPVATAPPQSTVVATASASQPTHSGTGINRPLVRPAHVATEHRPAAAMALPPGRGGAPDPNELIQSVQSGEFTGTYSNHCIFHNKNRAGPVEHYTCQITATSQVCEIKMSGSTTTSGCVVDLFDGRIDGTGVGVDGGGVDVPYWHCAIEGSGKGTVRFRASPRAPVLDIPVTLTLNQVAVSFDGDLPGTLKLSASFPSFGCAHVGSLGHAGLQGTLGPSSSA